MNRVNGVYNREFSVQMNFIANEDTLIWPTTTGSINGLDPFNAINSNGGLCLDSNQQVCTRRVGAANYDCGHVFTTGGGGISGVAIVCSNSQKARSVTGSASPVGDGFDIDYVSHEMGHQFGSRHTFNNNSDGSCAGNASSNYAYEPSSGSTILAYAGICSPDNVQPRSDDYFCASSLVQIQGRLSTTENVCAVITSTGNKLVYIDPFSASYTIPYKTPFELTAPTAVDSVADTVISYCWEQSNRGDFGARIANTYFKGPIFRSYLPKRYDPTRVFPKLSMILSGNLTSVSANGALGEKAPDTTRYLTFKLTLRNILDGKGCFLFPDDTIHIDAISTGAANGYGGFKVTSQNAVGTTYAGGSSTTITWDVVGSDAPPVSCSTVAIYMSEDAGVTWPYLIGTFPNNGSADITVPNPVANTVKGRFKVKGQGNVFFNLNLKNMTITNTPTLPPGVRVKTLPLATAIKVFPVPAHDVLHITKDNVTPLQASVYNAVGQIVWSGNLDAQSTDIQVSTWATGVYYIRFVDVATGERLAKSVVIN